MDKKNILFLCTGNSARSILSEVITNTFYGDKFNGFSAGSQPSGKINQGVLTFCKELGYPVEKLHSKSWDVFLEKEYPKIDILITVCDSAAKEVCPIWPNKMDMIHWGLADPVGEKDNKKLMLSINQLYEKIDSNLKYLYKKY